MILADYFVLAPSFVTLRWGWIVGLVSLLACLGLHPIFLDTKNDSASRPFKALGTVAVGIYVATWLPPWADTDLLRTGLYGYFCACLLFLLCSGVSYQVLRALRLQAPWWPFFVMFPVSLLIRLVFRFGSPGLNPGLITGPFLPQNIWPVEWAALFASLFTAFWWLAIRPSRRVDEANTSRSLT